jgi:hypothetical protein
VSIGLRQNGAKLSRENPPQANDGQQFRAWQTARLALSSIQTVMSTLGQRLHGEAGRFSLLGAPRRVELALAGRGDRGKPGSSAPRRVERFALIPRKPGGARRSQPAGSRTNGRTTDRPPPQGRTRDEARTRAECRLTRELGGQESRHQRAAPTEPVEGAKGREPRANRSPHLYSARPPRTVAKSSALAPQASAIGAKSYSN